MRFFTFTAPALMALLGLQLNAQTTVTIPLSQGTGADAYLASGASSSNYGTHADIGGNTWTCGGSLCLSRGLFKFDLSSIPAGATITNASLQLFADPGALGGTPTTGSGNSGYLMRVTAPWTENVVTWASQPTTTTANQVTVPASTSSTQDYTLTVTSLVQDMITNTNYGFMLKMQDEVNYYKALMFASSDNSNTSKCPVLTVTYVSSASSVNTSISLCQGAGEDAYLASGASSSNYGTHVDIGGNTWTCGGSLCLSRGLFKFDLSTIPAGAMITNASLQLFADPGALGGTPTTGSNNSGYLVRVTAPWSENTVTWASQPSTTGINQAVIPASTSAAQDYTITVTSLVQDMITNTNYGFMLKMQDEVNYYKALMFASSDNANASTKCPVLNISYINTTGIAEQLHPKTEIKLTPNPFSEELSVSSSESISKIVVTNTMGALVFEESNIGSNTYKLNKSIAAGLYFISVYSENTNVPVTKKIIRN